MSAKTCPKGTVHRCDSGSGEDLGCGGEDRCGSVTEGPQAAVDGCGSDSREDLGSGGKATGAEVSWRGRWRGWRR